MTMAAEPRMSESYFTGQQDRTCNDLMRDALDLWQKVTGVDPTARGGTLGDWDIRKTYEQINEAVELDPSGVTAILLVAYFANDYLAEPDISLLSLLDDPERIAARLEHPRKLLSILRQPVVTEARDGFIAALGMALQRYDAADRKDVQGLLEKYDDIAVLRRDALRSIANLRVDQFLEGEPETPDVIPVYNRMVHQWWNINSLLAAATHMPSGVSLNLIRDPDGYQSYFCFTIRNGGNLFVLSDVPKHAHPLQAQMSRRPDRDLARRTAKNWFPYDLLNLKYDEESGRLFVEQASRQKALVAYQNVALPLQSISETHPEEVVWISMMFDLIVERFWRRGYKAPALSYTGEMIKAETALIGVAQSANLPVPTYKPIGMKPLSREDVGSAGERAVGKKYHEPNKWMEERYGHQVSEDALNMVALPDASFAIEHKTGAVLALDDEVKAVKGQKFHALCHWQQQDVLGDRRAIEKLNATSFGTRAQLEKDRRFIARYNYATQIGALATDEFEARKDEVLNWYLDRVMANMPNILRWAGSKKLWVDDGVYPSFTGWGGDVGPNRNIELDREAFGSDVHIMHSLVEHYEIGSDEDGYRFGGKHFIGQFNRQGHYLCYLNGTRASWLVMFSPTNPTEVAWLAGCHVEDLPDLLHHWILLKPCTGNSILDRVDPMIWKARNPWLKLNLGIRFGLSKRAMVQVRKDAIRPEISNLMMGDPDDPTGAKMHWPLADGERDAHKHLQDPCSISPVTA